MSYLNYYLKNYHRPKYFIAVALIFLVFLIYVDTTYTFIGRGDYANYSNVARNLVNGRGFTVDYLAWHYLYYPELSHPEDMWPILQPVWIALSFIIFGIGPVSARFPNALFLVLLTILTYFVGRKLFSEKVGFWAAVLTGLNIHLLRYSTDWITSDVALAVFSIGIFYVGYLSILEAQKGRIDNKKMVILGLLSGLAVLQKPMGILLPVIYFIYLAYFYRRNLRKYFRPGIIFILCTLVFVGPFFLRNLILFGTFFLPIEHYLGYQIKYFPYEEIFSIYYGNPPSIQTWLSYGWNEFLKVNFRYLRYAVDTFIFKDLLMPYTVIVLSLFGLNLVQDKRKHFFQPLIILFAVMSLLMATYWHYESRYYSMLIPIFNILAVMVFFSLVSKVNIRNILLTIVIFFITFLPSVKSLIELSKPKGVDPSLTAYNWIKYNTPKEAVIMTLTPWELNFHSERRAVVIPNEDKETILWMAKKYKSDYLELEFLNEIKRESLTEQYQGKGSSELLPIYQDQGNVYIFKINWDQVKLDESKKPDWFD